MSTRTAFYRRRFLNRPRRHLGAHVIAELFVERPRVGKPGVSATLHIADCSRCVTIDLDAYDRGEAANALHRIAVLRDVVTELERALNAAIDEVGLRR